MTHKSQKIAESIRHLQGRNRDARYLGYFECFNHQRFYEAHDVLEDLWLADKKGLTGNFYKGLIQLAGAFVHLQKQRLRPAAALFRLASANLERYPSIYKGLDVRAAVNLVASWHNDLAVNRFETNSLATRPAPQVFLFDVG